MSRARVAVTGIGAHSCAGPGIPALRAALRDGRPGLRPIRRFDPAPYRNRLAGECEAVPSEEAAPHRGATFLAAAVREAAGSARLAAPLEAALVVGTNFGGLSRLQSPAAGSQSPAATPPPPVPPGYFLSAATDFAGRAAGVSGPRPTLSLACASGAAVAGIAFDLVSSGRAPLAIAAAYDELSELAYAGLSALRAITHETIRPFDRRRSGTLFAEGAGALVLESLDAARARGAAILAEVLGFGCNNDAHNLTAPETEGRGIEAVMRIALADARVEASAVDHVNAHGTGTQSNDPAETAAVKRVLGPRAREIPVVSIKPIVGHMMGAAGAVEAIATILSLAEGFVPPTLGLEEPDSACDLDYVPGQARAFSGRIALSNSFGIGGANACIVLKKWEGA